MYRFANVEGSLQKSIAATRAKILTHKKKKISKKAVVSFVPKVFFSFCHRQFRGLSSALV
jgi:hypothetical protein